MSIPISGILLDPYGNVARFADIKFVTVQGALDVIESSSAVFRTDENGAYSIDVQFGRFAVLMRFNGNNGAYEKIQTISVNSDTVATTLGELLEYTEPLTPGEILIVQQLVQQATDARNDAEAAALAALLSEQNAAASAAAALASENAAANSVALLAPVPLNGGVWAAGQTFTAYNQYMIFDGEAYSPRQETVLPYVVGATPDLGFVYQIKLNSLQALSGLTEPSDLDLVYARAFNNVSDMVAYTGHALNQRYLTNGDNGITIYDVVSSASDVDLGGGLWAKKINIRSRWDQPGFNASGAVSDAYNVIAGHSQNSIVSDTHSCVIAGGGSINRENAIGYSVANVNTPVSNLTGGEILGTQSQFCLIGGGYDNVVNGLANVIPVGQHCFIDVPADHGTITGGSVNSIHNGSYSAIYAGSRNEIHSDGYSGIFGGGDNYIGSSITYSTIGGGSLNSVFGSFGVLAGGQSNIVVAGANTAAIGGGSGNRIEQQNATISGGNTNKASNISKQGGAVGGGLDNTVAGECSSIVGGRGNEALTDYSQASGRDAVTHVAGQDSFANGKSLTLGDRQYSRIVLKASTSGLENKDATLADGTTDISTQASRCLAYTIRISVGEAPSGSESAMIVLEGTASRGSSGTWVISNKFSDRVQATAGLSGISAQVTENGFGSLRLRVTGVSGRTLRYACYVELVEVATA